MKRRRIERANLDYYKHNVNGRTSAVLKWLNDAGYSIRAISVYLQYPHKSVPELFTKTDKLTLGQIAIICKLLENDKKHSIADILRSLFLPHTDKPEVTEKLEDLYKVISLPELPNDVPKYRKDFEPGE